MIFIVCIPHDKEYLSLSQSVRVHFMMLIKSGMQLIGCNSAFIRSCLTRGICSGEPCYCSKNETVSL